MVLDAYCQKLEFINETLNKKVKTNIDGSEIA